MVAPWARRRALLAAAPCSAVVLWARPQHSEAKAERRPQAPRQVAPARRAVVAQAEQQEAQAELPEPPRAQVGLAQEPALGRVLARVARVGQAEASAAVQARPPAVQD